MYTADAAGAGAIAAYWVGLLPPVLGAIATALAIVYYAIQIYDWFEGRRTRHVDPPDHTS